MLCDGQVLPRLELRLRTCAVHSDGFALKCHEKKSKCIEMSREEKQVRGHGTRRKARDRHRLEAKSKGTALHIADVIRKGNGARRNDVQRNRNEPKRLAIEEL